VSCILKGYKEARISGANFSEFISVSLLLQ
jgi:hypothetical protein